MKTCRRGAFTLVELVTAIAVLGVIAAVLLPIINGAADSYAGAAALRAGADRAGFAMDRCLQTLRESPAGSVAGSLDITTAASDRVIFGDGHGIEYLDGVLYLRDSADSASPLCRDVNEFVISYVGADGVTSTASSPANTHRYYVTLRVGEVGLSAAAFPRVLVVKP